MQTLLNTTPIDWFDELAAKILDTLFRWRIGGPLRLPRLGKVQWVFDFDEYRNGGRTSAVKELLIAFSEKSQQTTIHSMSTLAGFVVMSSEEYDFSMLRTVDPDPDIKNRYIAAILRREFGG